MLVRIVQLRERIRHRTQLIAIGQQLAVLLLLVLVPVGSGIGALLVAPPARVSDVGLDGLAVSVGLHFGSNTTEVNASLLGGLRSTGPKVLGKHIGLTIRPEAANLTLFDAKGALDPATIDVAGHLFADPQAQQAELNRLTGAVIRYYGLVGLGTCYLVAMLEILGYWYLKFRRRQRVRSEGGGHRGPATIYRYDSVLVRSVAALVALIALLPAGYAISPLSNRTVPVVPDQALSGTFLADWQLTGPFSYLVRQAVATVDSLGRSEQRFYDDVEININREYAARFGESDAQQTDDLIRVMVLDDLQGTSGMARTVGQAAQYLHASAIINLGDLTATGTVQEAYLSYLKSYTVGVLSHYAGNIPVFTSLGRHDTPAVKSYARKLHITVADGMVQKVAGLSMIGVNSPYLVNFGQAARLIDPAVTSASVAAGLRSTACDQHPLAVFTHDKELLDDVVDSGCVPLVIGGHDYVGQQPSTVDTATGVVRKVILGSTGG
ncbi:MAG: hypothetical protein ABI418_15980, partial [Jatrophihabitantaceae bacterium]